VLFVKKFSLYYKIFFSFFIYPELHLYSDIIVYNSSQAQNVSAKSQYLERVNISRTSLSRVSSTERPSSDL